MPRRRLAIAGALAGVASGWLIAPQLYTEFTTVRVKVVRDALAAPGGRIHVPIPAVADLETLRDPFVTISRIRNDGTSPVMVRIALDDGDACTTEIPPGRSLRVNCAHRGPWNLGDDRHAVFASDAVPFTLEYFEVATHYGAVTPGPRHIIVGPPGFSGSRTPPAWFAAVIGALVAGSIWSIRAPHLLAPFAALHLAITAPVLAVTAIVIVASRTSPYSLLVDGVLLAQLLAIGALPIFWAAVTFVGRWLAQARVRPLARTAGVALLVGGVFLSLALDKAEHRYGGNASGFLLISQFYFDGHPTLSARTDIRDALAFSSGRGYDGQFFYFMTFDPFLTEFRGDPAVYDAFIDTPAYRYGRIGFSLLTKLLSGDDPARYPVTMMALVVVALVSCGALLAAIARGHGASPWYGALVAIVPGFWQTVETALPEPLAIAGVLGAYLCVLHRRWWACGVLLAASMIVRETSGALVVAVLAAIWLQGERRAATGVTLMAFVPIVLWKVYVAWVFWPITGPGGLAPAPDDVGLPFAGVWHLWTTIADGVYYPRFPALSRAGMTYPLLVTSAILLAGVAAVRRPSPMALAGALYAALAVTYNYHGVWAHVGNAERLTIDLFVAIAIVGLQIPADRRTLTRVFALFWVATACYMLFATFEAASYREALGILR